MYYIGSCEGKEREFVLGGKENNWNGAGKVFGSTV